MKKILIFSDTHGYTDGCINTIVDIKDADAVIHAGDYVRDAEDLESIFPDIPIYYVCGNNDIFSNASMNRIVEIEGKRIFITHGHGYNVKYETDFRSLVEKGREVNADLVIFGHTHKPYTAYEGDMIVINPGSAAFTKTYAIAEIDSGNLITKILEIGR